MAAANSSPASTRQRSHFDELRWVIQIRQSLDEEIEDDGSSIQVSVFDVPKSLLVSKPEAYIPQVIAFGPYHHWHPELYDMEKYKLAAAKRAQKQFQCAKLKQLVDQLIKLEHKIRAHYHRHLDFGGEALALMMAVDASFLLDFLQIYASKEDIGCKSQTKISARMSHLFDYSGKKSAHNLILRDVMMLENQIPIFLLKRILELQCTNTQAADELLSKMLMSFLKVLCPFKMKENFPEKIDMTQHAHLLELLYYILVPKFEEQEEDNEIEEQEDADISTKEQNDAQAGPLKQLFCTVWDFVCNLDGAPIRYIKEAIVSRPAQLVVNLPWKMVTSVPGFSILAKPVGRLFSNSRERDPSTTHNINKPPRVEEIMIPSVSELASAGVKFSPTKGDLTTIVFDIRDTTFHLPSVTLDVNVEVILRNLVAYEASAASGPLVFARYTELMNGIIDTEQDVKILREAGVIKNRMKSDGQVANLWNCMSKSVRLTRVPFLDKVIEDVNKYHSNKWSVKAKKFMKKYIFGSWQLLTFLAAILLLLMTGLQAFCSVYTCSSWFGVVNVTN